MQAFAKELWVFGSVPAVVEVFENDLFRPLLRVGGIVLAEALVGISNGRTYYNVSNLLIFEPERAVGMRQIMNVPDCERRILLAVRGVRNASRGRMDRPNGFIIGKLVHALFEQIAISPDKEELFSRYSDSPERVIEALAPANLLLETSLGRIGDLAHIGEREIQTVISHVGNLVRDNGVRELVLGDDWTCESPVAGRTIDGWIDLRSPTKIVDLKTTETQAPEELEQVQLYLVGDMIEHGVQKVREQHRGYLLRSSCRVLEGEPRVVDVGDPMAVLDKFIRTRHRYLLASARLHLPQITLDPESCGYCPFFRENVVPTACHFYCEAERRWDCLTPSLCSHANVCLESGVFHNCEVLDAVDSIRGAIGCEIDRYHELLSTGDTLDIWEGLFTVMDVLPYGRLLLEPTGGYHIDPPCPGQPLYLYLESKHEPLAVELVSRPGELRKWNVVAKGPSSSVRIGEQCRLASHGSQLDELLRLLITVDRLQRRTGGSSRAGIAFAGGKVVSGRPVETNSIGEAICGPATDVFCQCVSVKDSRSILRECLSAIGPSRILVIAADADPDMDGLHLSAELVERVPREGGLAVTTERMATLLNDSLVWMMSPYALASGDLAFLPSEGKDFFDYIIFFEVPTVNALHYYAARSVARRAISIGDANSLGWPTQAGESVQIGLGNNVLRRVLTGGFPVDSEASAILVRPRGQTISLDLLPALQACRMELPDSAEPGPSVSLLVHELASCMVSSQREDVIVVPTGGGSNPTWKLGLQALQRVARHDLQADLAGLALNPGLVSEQITRSFASGNEYKVTQPSTMLSAADAQGLGPWRIEVTMPADAIQVTNQGEAETVAGVVRRLRDQGIGHGSIAVMSPSAAQLRTIAGILGADARGISFRTPYGVRSSTWEHVLISCAADSLADLPISYADPSAMYTMLRTAIASATVVAHRSLREDHPFLRHLPDAVVADTAT